MNLNWICRLSLFSFFLLIGCTDSKKNQSYHIVFSQCVLDDAWRKEMLEEMQRELSFYPHVDFTLYDADGSSAKQIQQIEHILQKPIDLLIVSPNESEPLAPVVDRTYRQGVPVIVVDRKTSTEHYNSYVGANNYQVGKLASLVITQDNTDNNLRGKVIYITGLTNSSASIEREKGFTDGLKEYISNDNLIRLVGNWQPESAPTALRNLDRHTIEQADYIFCFNDPMAFACSQYLDSLQLANKPRIIGVDGLYGPKNGLNHVINKSLFATIHYPTGGKETIRTAMAILTKQEYQRNIDLGTMIIDSQNVHLLNDLEKKVSDQYADIDRQQIILNKLKGINKLESIKSNFFLVLLIFSIIALGLILYILRNLKTSKATISKNNETISAQNEKLENLYSELSDNFREKQNLFKNLTYSLSNPLALQNALLKDLNKKGYSYSIEQTRNINNLQNTTNRLHNIFQDIKNLENIHKNENLHVEETDFGELLRNALYSLNSLLVEKRINFKVENHMDHNHILISKVWMERALFNFIEFLIKNMPEEGSLRFKLSNTINERRISFQAIAGPFSSSALDRSKLQEELRLGVSISFFQDVIKQHLGEINFDFDHNFITFDIAFSQLELKDELVNDNEADPYLAQLTTPTVRENFLREKPSLIYIDNDPDWQALIYDTFHNSYNVLPAHSFHEAKDLLKTYAVEVIIGEYVINQTPYTNFLKVLQDSSEYNNIPFIMFSTNDAAQEEAYDTGCDLFIHKSTSIQLLHKATNNVLTQRRRLIYKLQHFGPKDIQLIENSNERENYRPFVKEVKRVMEEHIADNTFTISDLAKRFNLSRVHFYNRFNEAFETSPADYLLNLRLKKAMNLLLTPLTISEIAFQCGFSSPGYFTKVFSQKYHQSPKAYQRMHSKR
ncbi:substrate-binding domain-containing protein [Sphingobacterium paucimobilis]|uniref:HTH araC/xylS-type domain-containing protein n=1 Tax=Sphingobacterium paucimobilis HER1398 TaxID=1346330 RepID=U2J4M5_9SPHI|nr:substrate-binding domain-containing protein [Sphingobacterium paucimobilis]ERJ59904.1 hypothetical protein M472_14120 [Sphingobacterium paucimobilis HER1398]